MSRSRRREKSGNTGSRLDSRLEYILASGEARSRKPNGEIFRQALTCLNLPPSQASHIGDTPDADLEGATAAGIPAALVERPHRNLLDLLANL